LNLAEALNVAIPDIPIRVVKRDRPPRVDPNLIVRETIEDGQPFVNVLIPETRRYYPLQPEQWKLLRLFDGVRSYAEIAELFTAETRTWLSPEMAQQFAEETQDIPIWYRSPQERNIALSEKLAEERRRRVSKQGPFSNLAEITFSAWDPDRYLTKLHEKISFVFEPWFLWLNVAMFAWSLYLWGLHWKDMGLDTVQLFNFSQKSLGGFAEFWALMLFVGFVHESCHGLACKHTGAEVHRMGFLLIYLSPAFFCDVTEAWVYGGRWQRVTTMAAGLWSEMVLCFFATVIWWGTPQGTVVHRISYEFILLAGIGAVIINLNPLIKLDGYYIFTEMIGIADLKENSTNFLSTWVRRNIFRLPVEVPYVRLRRAALYVPYALLSAIYGYALLFVVVTLAYRVFYRFAPEWAFLPAAILALLIFQSRLRTLFRFGKTLYLDKKLWLKRFVHRPVVWVAGMAMLLFLFVPFWKQTIAGRFVLEPDHRSMIRTEVPGFIETLAAFEGEQVQAGTRLAELRNFSLEAEAARVAANYRVAAARSREAELGFHTDYAKAEQERRSLGERSRLLSDELSHLSLRSDIAGVVVTPRLRDRVGAFVPAGTLVAEVDEISSLQARIYVPEFDLREVRRGQPIALFSSSAFGLLHGKVNSVLPEPVSAGDPLLPQQEFRGARLPSFYVVTTVIPNLDGTLRVGETGTARIFVRRRSVWEIVSGRVSDFVSSKLW
jgi:putative peptide zinc metalloprotease protein